MNDFTEDSLTQQTLADYLERELGWESVHAFNEELGADGTLGRATQKEVVLTRYLGEALAKLNPGLPDEAYRTAIRTITEMLVSQEIPRVNKEKYDLIRDGVPVDYKEKGEAKTRRLKVFDFKDPENNHFLCVRELWIQGDVYRRRADIIGFVNGLPLLFVECKRTDKDLSRAYNGNISDYKDTIPHAFYFNAFLMLANGISAKIGSITAEYEHFGEWKRLHEDEEGRVDMETLLKGTCTKSIFMDIFENFIVFDNSLGQTIKILARNHQYLGVNRAIEATKDRANRKGRLGVFWHTQGAGKSYSMVMFTRKIRRKLGGDFTFLILTDRNDLDSQIYKTFVGAGIVNNDQMQCRADSGVGLKYLLSQDSPFVFSLIQKFNKEIEPGGEYSTRRNIIVITDEAHRTQYGTLAQNMRKALPNASFIGFTGTPLFKDDEITKRIFGDYVSKYSFKRAVEDGATVPLYYDPRGEKLGIESEGLNDHLAEEIEKYDFEDEDENFAAKLEEQLKQDYHIITAEERLKHIADDFVEHYAKNWETGKAMYVAIDKITAVRMHQFISERWAAHADALERIAKREAEDDQDLLLRKRQIEWMRETEIAVVISDSQGEVEKFRNWGIDIIPYRKRIKDGFTAQDGSRVDVDTAFKREDHPFRIVIVCAMWLTGFDVPALSTLYLDKPLRAHTLMQAIARANRVNEGKNNGLIVDYIGILRSLRRALATFGHSQSDDDDEEEVDPLHSEEDLLEALDESISNVREQLAEGGFELDTLLDSDGFDRNKALRDAKEVINTNDETRKRFEISARVVFKKYRACLTFAGVDAYKKQYQAIRFLYRSLEEDKRQADTSAIIRKLNAIVSDAINVKADGDSDDRILDISKINFDVLSKEFAKSRQKNTDVQALKEYVENRLHMMIALNPLRTNFQDHYNRIIAEYNREKDKNTIEATFEALMKIAGELSEEEHRYVKEGLENDRQLAIYDMLCKPDLDKAEIRKIKSVSVNLLNDLMKHLEARHDTFSKQSTSSAFRSRIRDFLFNEETGLPTTSYTEQDVEDLTENLHHYFRNIELGKSQAA